MNPTAFMCDAEAILNRQRPIPGGFYLLYTLNHKLGLAKKRSVPTGASRIIQLSSRDINEGLTSTIWNKIDATLRRLQKEGKL